MSYGVLPVTFKFCDMEPLAEIWGYYMEVLPRYLGLLHGGSTEITTPYGDTI